MGVGSGGGWKILTGVFVCSSLILLYLWIRELEINNRQKFKDGADSKGNGPYPVCGQTSSSTSGTTSSTSNIINTTEAANPGLYDDLTVIELRAIQNYMYGLTNMTIVRPSTATVRNSYIFASDLHPPRKAEALAYMAGRGPRPDRNARLVVFRGDASPPVVEEYIVGPLPNPTRHVLYTNSRRKNPVPYAYRPLGEVEYNSFYDNMFREIDSTLSLLLRESYGGTFTACENTCLTFYAVPIGSRIVQQPVRKMWVIASHSVEYFTLNNLDLIFLFNINSANSSVRVEKVLYAGREYPSLDNLALQYNTTSIPKTRIPFPRDDRNLFSSMNRRGAPVPREPKRAPRMVEPDGKRYSLKHRSVEYMQWKFDFRMSTLSGPQLYNIRFNDERIAYEIGMQEIAVYYGAHNPAVQAGDFIDSGVLLGTHSQSLVPGADCPETSTFINAAYIGEGASDEPVVLEKAFCLFELNSGVPLRRHLSYSKFQGAFYSGMTDNVLILRSILTIDNYDYVTDFIFHQSGALEVRVMSTGYIFAAFHTPEEAPYGFKLQDNIFGPIHHHMFLFKADIDINGTSNRYETLDISAEEVRNEQTTNDPSSRYNQIRFDRRLKETEMAAAYKFNFDNPMYHVIHNEQRNSSQGELKAYRIQLSGMAKQLLPEDQGNEILVSWARHQLLVTQFKEDERDGSSPYGLFDSLDPTVNFTSFLADDESIVDQDLVLWIPMGAHHIPHTEDLPVTPTAGSHMGFTLLPYNYFPECPSSQSRDSVRVEYKDQSQPSAGLRVERYGTPGKTQCVAQSPDYDQQVSDRPSSVLQYP
ncbi:putative amine oxidase [copper-containing] [Haliotis rufescens]|uniref:putative amine oxidase [copper-containing] n=1 Tax=Haliotis rufescens TaxID=6454 RepID=UPI00201ED8F8|nr:putative amine oxidase [copper-containing] [Haliotis rufescens]